MERPEEVTIRCCDHPIDEPGFLLRKFYGTILLLATIRYVELGILNSELSRRFSLPRETVFQVSSKIILDHVGVTYFVLAGLHLPLPVFVGKTSLEFPWANVGSILLD